MNRDCSDDLQSAARLGRIASQIGVLPLGRTLVRRQRHQLAGSRSAPRIYCSRPPLPGVDLTDAANQQVRDPTIRPRLSGASDRENIVQRSEEHTSELQSLRHLVCRLLLEKKKKKSQ